MKTFVKVFLKDDVFKSFDASYFLHISSLLRASNHQRIREVLFQYDKITRSLSFLSLTLCLFTLGLRIDNKETQYGSNYESFEQH